MATKTLGVKFEIAGVKEAQAGLNNFRNNLNQSLQRNKQAVNDSLKLSNKVNNIVPTKRPVTQQGEEPYDFVSNYQRTVQAVREKQYQKAVNIYARPRVNKAFGGFYEGIGNAAGARAFNQLDGLFRKLTGREEYRESVDLSTRTIDRIGLSVANALTGRSGSAPSQRDRNLGKRSQIFGQRETFVDKAINQALMPLKTIQYSFYEGIGAKFGDQFATGLSTVLNDDLDFSMERKGQVSGKAISYTATEGVEQFKGDLSAVGDNYNDLRYAMEDGRVEQVSKKFDTLFKSVTKSITSIGDSYLRGFRKGSVQLEALRKMEGEIAKQDNQAPDLTGKKKVIYTVSGFAGEKGKRGDYMAEQLKPYVQDDTAVIGADNKFTDVLSPSDKNAVLWGISALSNLAKINLKGFNPDAVELAAKVVNTIAANPEVEIDLLGHSAGGFVVEETQEILNQLGYGDRVKTRTVGTPQMAGNLDADGVDKIMGDNDFRIKPLEEALEYVGAAQPTEKVVSGVKDHFFQDYLDSDEFLEEILGDSLDKDKAKAQKNKQSSFQGRLIELESLYAKYVSTMYQNLDDLGEELSVAPDRLIAKNRRGRLRDRGGKEVQRKLENRDYREIKLKEGTETAVLVAGGFSGARGRSGAKFAKGLNELVEDDKTQYVGVRNPFTDIMTPDDVRNPDSEKTIPKILEMFGQVHQLGYNPDATEIAAQVMDLLSKNPNLKVKVGGFSGGGYVMEDVMELLQSQGVDMKRVEVMGIGTPQLPGGIKNRDFKKVLGKADPVVAANQLKDINDEVKKIIGFDVFPELMSDLQNIEGIEKHDINDYITNSKEVQDFFYGSIPNSQELLGNYSEIGNLQKQLKPLNEEALELSNIEDSPEKFKRLREIRKRYINLLKQIHTLAKYSQSIGGGKAFADERELAALELEDAGVIVDPIKVETPTDDPWKETQEKEQEVVSNRAKVLAAKYKAYLQNLIKESDRNSQTSSTVSKDFKNLDKGSQQNYIQTICAAFSTKARLFRDAVKTGQLEIAKEQGEQLIKLAGLIKNLYGNIQNDDDIDSEVKSNLAGYARYATSVQNEVVSGSQANGRTPEGLTQNFEAQLNLTEEDGANIAEGFVYGILENLADARDAGEQLIDAVDEGIRDRGEIQSPSKLAKRLGKWFAQGFGLGMAAENLEERGREVVEDAANGLKDQIKQSIDPDNLASLLDTGGAGLIKKIGSLIFDASQNEQFDEVLGIISKLIGKVFRLFVTFKLLKVGLDALGLGKFIGAFQNLPEKALESAIAVESLDKRINDMSGSAVKGAENLAFITEAAKRLNKNLSEAKDNYSQILGSTQDTSLEGFQTENIYSAFAATAKFKGLSNVSETEIFRSVRSIIGKDILSQEEVRQEIGEKLGDFEKSLADAYGVSRPQLNEMIKNREIRATEALPKVSAVLSAKNDIGGVSKTGAAIAQRLDNSIVSFQESVGGALLPIQKFGNNFLAGFFNKLAGWVDDVKGLVHGFFIALFVNLLRLQIFGQSVQKMLLGLIKLLWTMKGAMGVFLAEMILIAAAWKAWENVISQLSDRFFPQINKDIDQLTRGMKAYRQAIDDANDSQSNLGNGKLQLAEGFKLPENNIGDAIRNAVGSDYLNLDSLAIEPLNKLLQNNYLRPLLNFAPGGSAVIGANAFFPNGFKTVRENREEQLKIDNSRLSVKGNQLITQSSDATNAAQEINQLDAQIAEIQSKRLNLLPGDADALKASLAEEKKINQERDKQLKILTKYQQTLQTSINVYKTRLEDIEQRFLNGEIDQQTYDAETNNLAGLLDATEDQLKGINSELNQVAKNLSVFQRRLRNSNERVDGFLAQSDRESQQQRAGIIEAGIANGDGTQTIQIELEEAQQQDLQNRIAFIKGELNNLEEDLKSPELADGVRRIKQNLQDNNLPINETSLQRIIEESTVKADRDAAEGLLKQLRDQTKLAGLTEQFANTLQQNRNALIDFNRTIDDYFFNINQQIKEAQIEVLRVIDQIIQTQIRNKLQSALSPNANSFVNSLISSTQSLLDQAASYAEKLSGQKIARVQFERQERSLEYELQDFARNVKGAGDALQVFEARLRGESPNTSAGVKNGSDRPAQRTSPHVRSNTTDSNSFAGKTKAIALSLNIDPEALMTIMLFESAGTLSPKIQGANVPGQGRGRGLIQFMPATAKGLGTSDAALAKMTDIQQLDYVEKYFAQFKNFGAGKLENLYAAVLAGNPLKVNASDGYVTARQGAKKMTQQYSAKARALLGTSDLLSVPSAPPSSSGNLPPAPPILDRAERDTNFAISKQEQVLDLQDSLIANQEKETLEISIENNLKSDRQKIDFNITDSQFALDKLQDAGKDLLVQYDFQSADSEAAKSLRAFNTAFSDRGLQISREIIKYTDEINAINDLILQAPANIRMLRKAGRNYEADILEEKTAQDKLLLKPYQDILKSLSAEYLNNTQAAKTALKFVNAQNDLKIQQENINKRSLLVNQQATLAEQRGTVEAKRKVKLHQEDLRLHLEILRLKQQYPSEEYLDAEESRLTKNIEKLRQEDSPEVDLDAEELRFQLEMEKIEKSRNLLDSLIKGERRQSQVNTENINYDSQIGELELEKQLIDLQTEIGHKKAGFMSRFGLNFQAERLKKENALRQEQIRHQLKLIDLRRNLVDKPDELIVATRIETELNNVNLEDIRTQFQSLGRTVEDAFVSSTQGFFDQFTTNFFDGQSQRNQEVLQERLRYAEEIAQLEQQYRDEPGKLYHLKSRAKELNEQKLDQISGQFGIFKRVVNLAQQALVEFVKQLAKMAAQQAAAKFLNSILGSVIGGIGGGGVSSVGNDFGGGSAGIGAFVADEGATVGSVTGDLSSEIKKRKIGDRTTNILRRTFPGIANAWSQEGEGARLGVFHVGEELLSRKTGEAGRYQGLKQKYGINPLARLARSFASYADAGSLAKIGVFADGGTIGFDAGANILAGFDDNRPRIDLSVLSELDSRGRGQAVASRTVNLTQQIFSPSEDSFMLNSDQRNQDLLESLQRGFS